MFENEWFPKANAIGISWDEFWGLNPHILSLMIKAYNEKQKDFFDKVNLTCHLMGVYNVEALMSTVGNMFSKKGAKPHEYPKKPFEFNKEVSAEDVKQQQQLFLQKLLTMKTNFELNHKDGMGS